MHDNEQVEFTRHLSVLCSGFNVPLADRSEAYWRAFRRLQLSEFIRLVDAALASNELDKMPTVAGLRALRKTLKVNTAKRNAADPYVLLTEAALGRWKGQLSEWQMHNPGCHWSYIVRDPTGPECELLGLIIERDPKDPVKFPERRLLVSEYRRDDEAA